MRIHGGINMERISEEKPQLESIINLLIHKHEIIIKYSNKARRVDGDGEEEVKNKRKLVYDCEPICVVYFTFAHTSSSAPFIRQTYHNRTHYTVEYATNLISIYFMLPSTFRVLFIVENIFLLTALAVLLFDSCSFVP